MNSTILKRAERKEKKSFTLSRSSVAFLERLRKKRKARSSSLVLDELIRDADARERLSAIEETMTAYYDSMSEEEEKEIEAWGEFAMEQWREPPK